MKRVDFYLLLGRYSQLNLRPALHLPTEAHIEPRKALKMGLFAKVANGFIPKLLTFFVVKNSIVDVCREAGIHCLGVF